MMIDNRWWHFWDHFNRAIHNTVCKIAARSSVAKWALGEHGGAQTDPALWLVLHHQRQFQIPLECLSFSLLWSTHSVCCSVYIPLNITIVMLQWICRNVDLHWIRFFSSIFSMLASSFTLNSLSDLVLWWYSYLQFNLYCTILCNYVKFFDKSLSHNKRKRSNYFFVTSMKCQQIILLYIFCLDGDHGQARTKRK